MPGDQNSSAGGPKKISRQEELALKGGLERQNANVDYCEHLLKTLTSTRDGPEIWKDGSMKKVRECIALIRAHPDLFPSVPGDHMPDDTVFSDGKDGGGGTPTITQEYIATIATLGDLDLEEYPILQVAARPTRNFEENGRQGKTAYTHFTHLLLRDGSNDVITGRLNMNLSHEGKQLSVGDIIRPELFTPITYQVSGVDKPFRSPAIVIHTYSKVGYATIPEQLNDPLHCAEMTADELANASNDRLNTCATYTDDETGDDYEELEEVECTAENRYCKLYGLSPVVCICESDPLRLIDLEEVREFCWFATTDVAKMEATWKRNMLYWWYMTNTYNICGKGHRREPPKCLKAAIRKAWPEPSGRKTKMPCEIFINLIIIKD